MTPKCPEREKLMQTEGSFKKDRKEKTCLCFKEKKTVCLLCYESASVVKEYNLCRLFDTKHGAKYAKKVLPKKYSAPLNYDKKGFEQS